MTQPENRTTSGRFQKGVSGNPGGRPAAASRFRKRAQKHALAALATLVECLGPSIPPRVRVAAATALLDRAFGKPPQAVTGEGDAPLFPSTLAALISFENGGPGEPWPSDAELGMETSAGAEANSL